MYDAFDLDTLSPRQRALLLRGIRGGDGETADADRLTEIRNILGDAERLGALTDEEIRGFHAELLEIADRILDGTASGIDQYDTERLTEIAEAVEALGVEAQTRVDAAAERDAQVAQIMERIRPVSAEDPADGEPAGDPADPADGENGEDDPATVGDREPAVVAAGDIGGEPAPAPAAPADPAPAAPAVTAAAPAAPVMVLPSLEEVAARVPRAQRAQPVTDRPIRTEHPFIRAIERGENVTLNDLAVLMAERYNDFVGTPSESGGVQKIRLGRISIVDRFPEERRLRSTDSDASNQAKVQAIADLAMRPESWTPAIVATGGFCAPTEAVYDLEQISGTHRPLRDSLPSFQADRGGIRFTPPPDLADVLVDQAGGAVGEWTNATDITPGENVKTCQSISCAAVQEVLTKAIYRCLGFGNFGARAFPEHVRVWTLNAAAAWARKAEQEILDTVSTNSTAVTSTGVYGFVSELLTHILQLAYGERSRQRMPQETRLRLWLPDWVPAQMQIDLLRQGNVRTEVRPEAEIRGMFDVANVNVTFYSDSRTGAGQVVGPQAAAELRDLPEVVEWYLFHEGAHVHLTGGELDLGIVRDSTLNATNDFRIFAEEWAEMAFRGIFSYRVRSTLCPSGDRQIAIDGDPCGAS